MGVNFDKVMDKVFDGCKKLTPALVALAGASGLLLFLPSSVLEKMGLSKIPFAVKGIIGVIFIISSVLIVTIIIWELCGKRYRKYRNKKLRRSLREQYLKLPPELKEILIKLMKQPNKKMMMDSADGDVIYLLNNLFINQPAQVVSTPYDNVILMQYTPNLWLIDLYYNEPELFSEERL